MPRLLYFEDHIPEPYIGDLHREGEILRWISEELDKDEIKSVSRAILDRLIDKLDHVGVVFVDDENQDEMKIIAELEEIHDDLRDEDLVLVQIDDEEYEERLGLRDLPTLVHFCQEIPSVYSGM